MNAPSAVPSGLRLLLAGARSPRLRQALDAAVHLSGFSEPRADRLPTALTVHLGAPGAVTVTDRREGEVRTYRFAGEADDLAERIAAVAGGRGGVRAKVLLDPGACFIRALDLPSAALPRMRALLAEELEAATPFRAGAVYSDWFVEGEDVAGRTLRVRHVVIKKARLDPLLDALARAGLPVGPVAVGRAEDQTMPVDLLSHGHRALPALLGGARAGDLGLWLGAGLLLALAFAGWRAHQDATLAALDGAFAAARHAVVPVPPPVQAGLAVIEAGRAPPLARSWDALAAALPDGASATSLHLDATGALLTLTAGDEAEALAGLARVPGFGPPSLRGSLAEAPGLTRLVVFLPRADRGGVR
ncbi:hypothetical protein [Methylobacterium sp. J-076]|uniref:hypothetical protein n=1 Tax=Methylobacterium sp. J-076 TaxID=2836655 RepID=UPI001FBB5D20|nr:hypothetical protein [Methylobacterium sp. J-076]MCJ2012629.1 hypothetical protein [Methylobacterium sp. J-076]